MAKAKAAMITYQIKRTDGKQFTVQVPASWKVTFGAVHPGSAVKYGGTAGWALRFYESKDKQRAIFTGISEFRDLSIPIGKVFEEFPVDDAGLVAEVAGMYVVGKSKVHEF